MKSSKALKSEIKEEENLKEKKENDDGGSNYGWMIVGAAIVAIGATVLFRQIQKK